MTPVYFFRPIWRMFDYRGASGRAEYFTSTVTSFLGTIFTLPFSDYPYARLLDLLQSTEDWKISGPFDTALYAIVQPGWVQGSGRASNADVFIPVARKEVP